MHLATAAQGDVAIDDIRIVCSEEATGFCKCKEGYVLSDNGDCVPDMMTVIRQNDATQHMVAFLEQAGIADTLAGDDDFTMFLPSSAAAAAMDNATAAYLLADANRDTLRAVLGYHIVRGRVNAGDISNNMRLSTLLTTPACY